jgi:hypothetical protein
LFGERAADVLTGFDHVICLGLAGGVAAIVTEAGTLQELSELPGFSVRENDGYLDSVHDSLGLDVSAAGIDLSLDSPGKAPVLEETCQFQGTVELL